MAAIGPHVSGVGWGIWNREPVDLALDVADGMRVVLAPGGELWSFPRARSFLLVSGRAWVQSLPATARAADPRDVRWVTPAGALIAASAGELWLRTQLQGAAAQLRARTQLRLVRGGVTWFAAAGGPPTLLTAQAQRPQMLGALQVLGAETAARSEKAWRSAHASPLPAAADARLELALSELVERRARSRVLLADAPAAGRAPASVPDIRAYQRELARRAQDSLASQERALMAAEQSLWLTLARCPRASTEHCPALAAWGQRFGARLDQAL